MKLVRRQALGQSSPVSIKEAVEATLLYYPPGETDPLQALYNSESTASMLADLIQILHEKSIVEDMDVISLLPLYRKSYKMVKVRLSAAIAQDYCERDADGKEWSFPLSAGVHQLSTNAVREILADALARINLESVSRDGDKLALTPALARSYKSLIKQLESLLFPTI